MSLPDSVEIEEKRFELGLPTALVGPEVEPLFWTPSRTGAVSAWWTHVPFAHWLVAALRPAMVVELGTHNGVSFAAFCEAMTRGNIAGRCFAVDTWRGDEHAGFYNEKILADLTVFIRSHYSGFAELLQMTFDDAIPYFEDGSIDLLHIDGLHTYDAVRRDFDNWLPKLSERGVVIFHDTNVRVRDFGVWKLWSELTQQYPSFEFLHGHGLGVLAVGRSIPAPIVALRALQVETANALRDRFAQIGARWELADFCERGEQQVHDLTVQGEKRFQDITAQSEQRIAALVAQSAAQESRLIESAQHVARLEADVASHEAERATRAQHVATLEADRERLVHQVANLDVDRERLVQTALISQERLADRAAALEAELAAERERLVVHTANVEAERQQNAQHAQEVQLKEQQFAERAALLQAKLEAKLEADLAAERAQIRELQARESSARAHVADRDSQIARLRAQAAESAAASAAEIDSLLQLSRNVTAHSSDQLSAIYGSMSWRITQPLRALEKLRDGGVIPPRSLIGAGRETNGVSVSVGQTTDTDAEVIKSSGLFDEAYYIGSDDARTIGISPIEHYILSGEDAGLAPSSSFDASSYRGRYDDLRDYSGNLLAHYVRYGKPEGRTALGATNGVLVGTLPATMFSANVDDDSYARWIAEFEQPAPAGTSESQAVSTSTPVRFSFLVPPSDSPEALAVTLTSLRAQAHQDWVALIASPDGSDAFSKVMRRQPIDERVEIVPCNADLDRGAALNALLERSQGSWIVVLDPGDALTSDALDHLSRTLAAQPKTAIAYSDEDKLTADGRRQSPQLKPSWSPELLQAFNYFGRLTLLSRTLVERSGGFIAGDGAGAEWSLNLRASDAIGASGGTIARIARILCHRAAGNAGERPAPYSVAAEQHRSVLREFWTARGVEAPYVETQADGTQRSSWEIVDPPLVSIIIPSHNKPDMLQRCMDGILDFTAYRNVEIIIVENRSDDPKTWELYDELGRRDNVRIIRYDVPFNYSAACNKGAAVAKGKLLLFLNNDIEVLDSGWLGEMVRVASLPGVGIVGTKLRYPTGELQHAGVAVGIHLYALMFHHALENEWGVFGSPNHTRNWLAIMGACQMVRREVFDRVDGFDEAYQIANSDIALCLRAHKAGWRTAFTPYAELLHHEGATRGHVNPIEDMIRSAREVRRLGIEEDPYLHPGLSALHTAPRLRGPGERDLRENLALLSSGLLADAPAPRLALDPFDDADVQAAAGVPIALLLWPPQPSEQVDDIWSAARWTLDLLRSRPDLRLRFPHALSGTENGTFFRWLMSEGAHACGLSEAGKAFLPALFAANISARARQLYYAREDVHHTLPLGLLPAGRRGLASYLLRDGCAHESLRLEEAWWLILSCAENPTAELVETYRFTPAWQQAHPYGLTIFGRTAFAVWLTHRYDLAPDTIWLEPRSWSSGLSAVEEIRLAYAATDKWQIEHPNAFENESSARALLEWLAQPATGLSADVSSWCEDRLADGTPLALTALGVNIIGHFCYNSGLRVSVEAISDSLEATGVAVSRRDMRTNQSDDPYHAAYGGLEAHDITVVHIQPEPYFDDAFARSDLAPRTPFTYRVAYWYWELETVPAYWAEKAAGADEIWVATEFVAEAMRRTIEKPVYTLFPGVRIRPFLPRSREHFGLRNDADRFTFLFSFHMGSIMERKNPLGLIRAFRQAFRPDEPVDLVLKTTSFGHEDQVSDLRAAADGANIQVFDKMLTSDETLSLMNACDAYVSLHRSEGLGLTVAEAMLLGKPVLATRYSGNLDFMDDENSLLVDYDLVELGRRIPPYDAGGYWAEPSVAHAAVLMRRLYENQVWARELGSHAQADAVQRLSLEAAGKRFASRLAAITSSRQLVHVAVR